MNFMANMAGTRPTNPPTAYMNISKQTKIHERSSAHLCFWSWRIQIGLESILQTFAILICVSSTNTLFSTEHDSCRMGNFE